MARIPSRRTASVDTVSCQYISTNVVTPPSNISTITHFGSQHDFVRGLLRLERPDIFVEPLHQGDVVGIAPLESHRHVAVGIDSPGMSTLPVPSISRTPGCSRPERFDPPGIVADQRRDGDPPRRPPP